MFRPISEWTLQKNEWHDAEFMHEEPEPYNPEVYNAITDETQGADRLNSEETDEEFDWFEKISSCRNIIEQVFYCYGNRTNKFLLLNYGFVFPNNHYDSYEIPIRLDIPLGEIFVPELVDLEWQ